MDENVQAERDRCYALVSAARSGDIDTDFRTILHFIANGTSCKYNKETFEYELGED